MKIIHDGELVLLIRKYLVSGVVSVAKVGTLQGINLSFFISKSKRK